MTDPRQHPEPSSMSYPAPHRADPTAGHAHTDHRQATHGGHESHGGHGLMMLICCIPMVAVAALLVASGIAGAGALVWVFGCVLMMAAMMYLMPGGHGRR